MSFHENWEKLGRPFEKGGKLEAMYPVWEALDTFFFTPPTVNEGAPHVRDAADLKRLMTWVVVALAPVMVWAMYNTGLQAHQAIQAGCEPLNNWQTAFMQALGVPFSPGNILACLLHGALYYLPVYIVTLAAGGAWEVVFAAVRKHEISEGFLVTSALFPLTLPATIPLWQVALGISFGVVIGKEVFGGVGMNIFNPALMSRAFLYFAYPQQIVGEVWIAAKNSPDVYSGATWLQQAKDYGMAGLLPGGEETVRGGVTWMQAFLGFEAGSMGETSALLIGFGGILLIISGVGSWRIMLSMFLGCTIAAAFFNALHAVGGLGDDSWGVPFWWHWVVGGFMFATVYMATDPVSASFTNKGKYFYGAGIGILGMLIRVANPAFPGSWMLAILFMNMFSPLIDYFVVQANIRRRSIRYAT